MSGRTARNRITGMIRLITVEPVEFIYCVMFSMSAVVRDNLFIDKVCRLDMRFDNETCYNMTHSGRTYNQSAYSEVKAVTTNLEVYDGILVALPSVIFCLFLGSWSDAHGRKALLVLPFLGNALSFISYIVCYAFFDTFPSKALLMGSVVGLSGGYICLNIGLYGYIGDVTTSESRTTRMSVLNGVFSLGYVVGNILGGQLYKAYGSYYLNFGISLALAFVGAGYAVAFVPESVTNVDDDKRKSTKFFDLANVKESFRTTLKARTGSGRARVLLLVINFAIFMFPLNSSHYDYLLFKARYGWDVAHFSNYLTAQRVCRFLGLFLILPLLSRVLRLEDALIAAAGTLGAMAAYTLIAVASGPGWLMYLSAILQFNSVITVTIRSQCTKEVSQDEIGKVFSVVGLAQALVPLVCNPIFGAISNATHDTLPGAYQLVTVGLLLFVLASSCYLFVEKRRTDGLMHEEEVENNSRENVSA